MEQEVVLRSLVGYAIVMLAGTVGGVAGAAIGFVLMPKMPSGGYYGAIGDAMLSLVLWLGLGFIVGYILGAFAADRVIAWVSRNNTH
jgi:hypothetical protein